MKRALRKEVLEKRCALGERELDEKSSAISEKLLSLQGVRNAGAISCYVGIGSEVRTRSLISKLIEIGKTVLVPLISVKENRMEMCRILSLSELEKKNSFFEPREGCKCLFPREKIDLVLVPGTTFDSRGFRLGYGKGYYDRFLKSLPKKVPLIGLSFECQLVGKIPEEKHDIKLDKIVTEKRVIEC